MMYEDTHNVEIDAQTWLMAHIQRVNIEVPPMLLRALGYTETAQFVAIYWEEMDIARYDDGCNSGTAEFEAMLNFLSHPHVKAQLRGYDLGGTDHPARHYLIIDTTNEFIFAGPAAAARTTLRLQWPDYDQAIPMMVVTVTEMEALAMDFWNQREGQQEDIWNAGAQLNLWMSEHYPTPPAEDWGGLVPIQ